MTQQRIQGLLELRLVEPATPRRVELAARLFAQMIDAASPGMSETGVTMVVSNYAMGATARARSPEGKKALQRVLAFIREPERQLARYPEREGILDAVVEFHREAAPKAEAVFAGGRSKKTVAVLDDAFVSGLIDLKSRATPDSLPYARGTTVVHTHILRIGRLADDGPVRARIRIYGTLHDVRVRDSEQSAFFDAAKSGAEVAVRLSGDWIRHESGETRIIPSRAEAIAVDVTWAPTSGEEALAALRETGSGIRELPSDQFVEMIERLARGV